MSKDDRQKQKPIIPPTYNAVASREQQIVKDVPVDAECAGSTDGRSESTTVEAVKPTGRKRRIGRDLIIAQACVVIGLGYFLGWSAWHDVYDSYPDSFGIGNKFGLAIAELFVWVQLLVGFPLFALWFGVAGLKGGKKWLYALAVTALCIMLAAGVSWLAYVSG